MIDERGRRRRGQVHEQPADRLWLHAYDCLGADLEPLATAVGVAS